MKTKENLEPIFETTTFWDFPTQNYGKTKHGDNKYSGVTPAFIIWNLIQRYTTENDLVVDPMCGSGTTIDVCKEENRDVIGYDIMPYRHDIIQCDARKLPLEKDSVDFIFVDPPYSDNLKYNDHPKNIGKISCTKKEYFTELEKVIIEIKRVLKKKKNVAWLIGDHWRSKTGLIPVGFKFYEILSKYFMPVDIIIVRRRNQTSNTSIWHYRAKKFNFYLRGFKYLLIFKNSKT